MVGKLFSYGGSGGCRRIHISETRNVQELGRMILKDEVEDIDLIPKLDLPENVNVDDFRVFSVREEILDKFVYKVDNEEGEKFVPMLGIGEDMRLSVTGKWQVSNSVFCSPVRDDIVHRVIRWQLAKKRRGLAKVKTRGEVKATTRKPHPQKGTGKARQGSKVAPHMRGGGIAHGPKGNRDWSHKLPKKVRRFGVRSCLSARFIEEQVYAMRSLRGFMDWNMEGIMRDMRWKSVLFIDGDEDYNPGFRKALSKMEQSHYLPQKATNCFDLLKYKSLVLSTSAIQQLEQRL